MKNFILFLSLLLTSIMYGQIGKQLVNPCDDGTFSSSHGVNNYDAVNINSFNSATQTSIQTSIPDNPTARVAVVGQGFDPILASLNTNINKVRTGSKALRINQNQGFHSQTTDDRMTDILIKTFYAESNSITFDYFAVLEEAYIGQNGINHNMTDNGVTRQPYFEVKVYLGDENSSNSISTTYRRIPNNLPGSKNYAANNSRFRYNSWNSKTINFSGDFVGQKVTVKFKVRDCFYGDHGGYVYIDNFTNNCPPTPTCVPSSCLSINAGQQTMGNCIDAQAWMNCPNQNMGDIDWYFSLGPVSNQFIGTTNNPGGSHAIPFTLPTPAQGQTWDNYYLWIHADITLDGNQCSRISKSIILDCTTGGGGGVKVSSSKIFPNPSTGKFQVQSDSKAAISAIKVRDIQGQLVRAVRTNMEQEIDLSGNLKGVYFVEIDYEDGSSEVLKLMLAK